MTACWNRTDYYAGNRCFNSSVYWKSSDESVATVSDDGLNPFTDNDTVEGMVTWHQTGKAVTITGSRWLWGRHISFPHMLLPVRKVPTPTLTKSVFTPRTNVMTHYPPGFSIMPRAYILTAPTRT